MSKLLLILFSLAALFQNSNNPGISFDNLITRIRDQKISKAEALKEFTKDIASTEDYCFKQKIKNYNSQEWVFPLKGYSVRSIGGKNGSGYVVNGYNFFDGNKHTGHPAHDIFINDRNQDCIDDKTKMPVEVLSISGGIVIGVEKSWEEKSDLRGGRYIWIYDPSSKVLFYYAHNSEVKVNAGDVVKPGDVIAFVGRTGLNAFNKRSPTHLHLMCLRLDNTGIPVPYSIYKELLKMKKK
ncbi:MAG: M23 family metallopeptidase [Bacteroidota bacterium]|nr:M23 family metallopeptidase [Bacteroidota bacterium]